MPPDAIPLIEVELLAERATSFTPSTDIMPSMMFTAMASRSSSVISLSLKLSDALICSEFTLGMKDMGISLSCATEKTNSATATSSTSHLSFSAPRSSVV